MEPSLAPPGELRSGPSEPSLRRGALWPAGLPTDNAPADKTLVNAVQKYIDPFGYKVTKGNLTGYVQNYTGGNVPVGETVFKDYDLSEVLATAGTNEFSYNSEKKYGWGHGNGQADIGAYVTVESATAKNIDVAVKIILKSGADLQTVKENIKEQIETYLKSTVFNDSYISYAKVGSYILRADGVLDYDETSLKLNNAKDNVLLTDSDEKIEIAILNNLEVTKGEQA